MVRKEPGRAGVGAMHTLLGAVGALAVQVTEADAALAAAASFDEASGQHASDHLPVCGTVVALRN